MVIDQTIMYSPKPYKLLKFLIKCVYLCILHHLMNPTIAKETNYNLLECETFNPLYALFLEYLHIIGLD